MNGPEHYAEAERLVAVGAESMTLAASASGYADVQERSIATAQAMLAAAQVHATLALAAAAALAPMIQRGDRVHASWSEVAS